MVKIIIKKEKDTIEAEEVLEREVKKFTNTGHILVPKKHIGKMSIVAIRPFVRQFNEGYLEKAKKEKTKKERF